MASDAELNVDSLITRLLEVRGCRPGKNVQMTENEIRKFQRLGIEGCSDSSKMVADEGPL